jgi:hypothetical protein
MGFAMLHGFHGDEVTSLRARRIQMEDNESERTWWVVASSCGRLPAPRRSGRAHVFAV